MFISKDKIVIIEALTLLFMDCQGFLFFKDTTSKQRKTPAFSWFLFSFLQSYAILLLNAIADFLTVSRGKVRLSLMGTR